MKIRKELWFGFAIMAAIVLPVLWFTPWGHLTNGHLGLLMQLLAEAEAAGRLRPEPMLTRMSFIAGAVLAPMLLLGGAREMGVMPAMLAPLLDAQVMSDEALQRRMVAGAVAHQRQGQPETGALARLTPRLQAALVQPGVLDADGQPQPGAPGAAHPRRIGAPEPAEHQFLLAGTQPDTVIADGDGDGVLVGGHPDLHRLVLGMIDGVGDEVAQDALDSAGINLGDDRMIGHVDLQVDTGFVGQMPHVAQRLVDRRSQVDRLDRQQSEV